MRSLLGLALLWSAAAHGGGWEPGRTWTVDMPGDAYQAAVTSIDGKSRVVVTGSFGTWTLDPSLGITAHKSTLKGRALWVDREYDPKQPDVLICGEKGVTLVPTTSTGFGETTSLILKPCHAIGLLDVPYQDYAAPITARDDVWLWEEDAEGYLRPKTQLGSLKNPAVIQVHKDEAIFTGRGADRVFLLRDNTITRQPAGGFVGGLAWAGDRWAWTLTDAGAIQLEGGDRLRVEDTPTRLVSGDLNGDGHTSFLVAHPRTLSLGVVGVHAPKERVYSVEVEAVSLSVGEWSGDECADVVVIANERKVLLIQGKCTAEIPTPTKNPTAEVPKEQASTDRPETTAPNPVVPDSTPLAIPVGVEPVKTPESQDNPAQAGPVEVPVGAGSWPLIRIKVGESHQLQLVDPTGQATAFAAMGGPSGFIIRSDGSALFVPKVTHVGRWRVAVRLWANGEWGRRGGFELLIEAKEPKQDVPPSVSNGAVKEEPKKEENKRPTRARELVGCDLGLGVAGGYTDVSENWAFINQSVQESFSPFVSFSCQDGRSRGYWWFAGADSAPTFVYFNNDKRYRHSIAATVGIGFGNRVIRAGVYGSVGFTLVGVGGRVVWYPFKGKGQLRHGFDLRATVFSQNQFAGQISLSYSIYLGDLW